MKEKIIFCVRNMKMVGGKERAVANLANALTTLYDISILNLEGNEESFYPLKNQVRLFTLNILSFLGSGKNIYTAYLFFKGVKALAQFIKREKPSILIGNDFLINIMLVIAKYRARSKVKIIGWEHISLEEPIISARKQLQRLRDFFYKKLEALVVITKSDADFCDRTGIKAFLISHPKSFTFDGTVDYAHKNILTIARLSYQKGLDLYLQLIASLKHNMNGWMFTLVAKEDDIKMAELEKMIAQYDVGSYINIQTPHSNVIDFYKQASIYLLTSRYEGLPLTLIEAQTCGLPCVSFDCKTGPSDIITQNVDGFIIPPFRITEMAEKLSMLMQSEELRERMGKDAQKASERYDEAPIIASWYQLIDHLTIHDITK